jgi:hypothetical protein
MPTKGKCERCGQPPPTIQGGEFAGQPGMLDYCEYCSADLCANCMAKGPCDDSPDGKHKAFVESEEE